MLRGEIRWADLNPVRGSEANKTRPVVIVSNDSANRTAAREKRGVITVVPVTTSVSRIYPFQVRLPARDTGLPHDSKAQAEQVRSIDVSRIGELVGRLTAALDEDIDRALRVHLSL